MLKMNAAQFRAACDISQSRADELYELFEQAMFVAAIVSPERAAMFLAQTGHESASFFYTSELWGPTPAQKRYGNRADLGNTEPEAIAIAARHASTPGPWWRGHGYIQTTGFYNHKKCGEYLELDLLNDPKLITLPEGAVKSSTWYWTSRALNPIADTGDVERVTRIINGGINGIKDRIMRYNRAIKVLR